MSDIADKIQFGENLSDTLFSDVARQTASAVYAASLNQRGMQEKNKSTQLRRFYDELTMWNDKVHQIRGAEERKQKYTELAPFIKMMSAKVAYAKARGHVDDVFANMFSGCVSKIQSPDSLKHCKLFIEAFMGFYKAQEK